MNCAHANTEVLAVNSPSGSGPIIRCLDCRECWYERLGPPDSPGYEKRAGIMREEYLARHRMPFETPANRSSEACERCRAGIPLHWRGGATAGGLVHTNGERCVDQDALRPRKEAERIKRDRAAGDKWHIEHSLRALAKKHCSSPQMIKGAFVAIDGEPQESWRYTIATPEELLQALDHELQLLKMANAYLREQLTKRTS